MASAVCGNPGGTADDRAGSVPGRISLEELSGAMREDTTAVSVMFANNEVGTIEPVYQIGKLAREHQVVFHTDAVQAYGQIPVSVQYYQIDLLSASAHKFHGPKGVGFLYIREGIKLPSYIHGGSQERGNQNLRDKSHYPHDHCVFKINPDIATLKELCIIGKSHKIRSYLR